MSYAKPWSRGTLVCPICVATLDLHPSFLPIQTVLAKFPKWDLFCVSPTCCLISWLAMWLMPCPLLAPNFSMCPSCKAQGRNLFLLRLLTLQLKIWKMEKKMGKTFLNKAIPCLFLFCFLWKVLTTSDTTKQSSISMWKNLIALKAAFVFSPSYAWRGSFKKHRCQSKTHYPKLREELAVSWGVCYRDTILWQTPLDIQIKPSAMNPGRRLFKVFFPFLLLLSLFSIWEQRNFPRSVHA